MRRVTALLITALGTLGCGKTSSNGAGSGDTANGPSGTGTGGTATTGSVSGQGGSAGTSASSSTLTASVSTTGVALSCTFPEDRECGGACVDVRTDRENCSYCNSACPEGQECIHARCTTPLTCEAVVTGYAVEDMAASGGGRLDDGWALTADETLSFEHTFQPGPAVLLLTARSLEGEPRAYLSLSIGGTPIEPLLIAATQHATYRIEYESSGGPELVSIGAKRPPGTAAGGVVAVQGVEVRDCSSIYGHCEGGGYYLPELDGCAPPVCSQTSDCYRDFASDAFLGQCSDGECRYPSCTDTSESGLSIAEEYGYPASLDTHVVCYSYAELVFPESNPRTLSLEGGPEDFTCPAVQAITWEIEPSRGEGSCVQVPICGPNREGDFGFPSESDECCYLAWYRCGV